MNKQELVGKLKRLLEMPPKKPIVPQFEADWYEDSRDDFEFNLYRLCIDYYNCDLDMKMMIWFRNERNKPIETLVMMHKFGYEVDMEGVE